MHPPRKPVVSVILCTHNPHEAQLEWALSSLESQSLPAEQFEVIVVDNCSRVPVSEEKVLRDRRRNFRLISEPKLGLTHARCTGIRNAQSELLVFVDDDNFLMADYLEQGLAIASREPEIGHFGGIAAALYEKRVSESIATFLPVLGIRDYGPEPITSREKKWGQWEPIGAGMICRRAVAEAFVRLVQSSDLPQLLGRRGQQLSSGEDSLFARLAVDAGYSCSYQPALRLFHLIRSNRLRPLYLARMQFWQGRSHAILEILSGRPPEPQGEWARLRAFLNNFVYVCRKGKLRTGWIEGFWHVGHYVETRAQLSGAPSPMWMGPGLAPRVTEEQQRSE